jgi:hypothetical protein
MVGEENEKEKDDGNIDDRSDVDVDAVNVDQDKEADDHDDDQSSEDEGDHVQDIDGYADGVRAVYVAGRRDLKPLSAAMKEIADKRPHIRYTPSRFLAPPLATSTTPIPTVMVGKMRPDIIIERRDIRGKLVGFLIVELTIPFDEATNMKRRRDQKQAKYECLIEWLRKCKSIKKLSKDACMLTTVEIGARGMHTSSVERALRMAATWAPTTSRNTKMTWRRAAAKYTKAMSTAALAGSMIMWQRRLQPSYVPHAEFPGTKTQSYVDWLIRRSLGKDADKDEPKH